MLKSCGLVGQSIETIIEGESPVCPGDWVEMKTSRPSPEYVADSDGNWVLPIPTKKELAEQVCAKRDEFMEVAYRKIRLIDSKVKLANYDGNKDDTPLKIKLTAWERYLVALSEIEQQPNFPDKIDWPQLPEDETT